MSLSGPQDTRRIALERIAAMVRDAAPMARPVFARPEVADAPRASAAPKAASASQSSIEPPFPEADDAASPLPDALPAADGDGADFSPSQTGGSEAPPSSGGESDAALDRRLASYPLTDLGNAERFRDRNRGRLIWCAVIGWLWWDGKRWAREEADEKVSIAAHLTIRAIQREAAAIEGTRQDRVIGKRGPKSGKTDILFSMALREWGRDSESNAKLNLLAKQAAAYLAVKASALDANKFAINCANGTLVIDRKVDGYVTFRKHNPGDLITKIALVDYRPDAERPLFDKFIAEVQPDIATRRTLQQWKGYSLTGDTSEQKLAVFYGRGKNGKSVFEEICALVAGDYCATTPIETFLAEGRGRNAGQATPDLAVLPGVRSLRTSEPKKGAQLDEGLIKLATGGEPIKARHLNLGYFDFYPSFKLTISGNYRPKIVGADEGIWRRIVLVPWSVTIAKEQQDKHLGTKLREEASGVLNWMLDGLRDWLDNGLQVEGEVESATAEYRRDSDQLGRFLEACTVAAPGERVQSTTLCAVFNAWSVANSLSEWKPKGFTDAMADRGWERTKSSVIYFLNLKLTKGVNDFVDHEGRPLKGDAGRTEEPYGGDDLAF